MEHNDVALSVVLVVGRCRERAQRAVNAVGAQTVFMDIELVIADVATTYPPLRAPTQLRTVFVPHRPGVLSPKARAAAVQESHGQIVAFITDHCFPTPTWAEQILEALHGNFEAATYAFKPANPDCYVARATFMADYGQLAEPARSGAIRYPPGGYVAYKRDLLERMRSLAPDRDWVGSGVADLVGANGGQVVMVPTALVEHENFASLRDQLPANWGQGWLFATDRVRSGHWGWLRRLLYALAAPPVVPSLRLLRLILHMRGRAQLSGSLLTVWPIVALCYSASALGESFGYLIPSSSATAFVERFELMAERRR